jgi:hypothetical protein
MKPKSKGDCNRLLIQTAPPLDHKYGFFKETVEKWAAKWDLSPKEFWKSYGVNTCVLDNKTGKVVYYPEDVERAIRGAINKSFVHPAEWD